MIDGIPPEWAGRAFCERANLNYDTVLHMEGEQGTVLRSAVKAGAILVAAHEEPPVDPLLVEARLAAKEWLLDDTDDHLVQVLAWALKRGIELAGKS